MDSVSEAGRDVAEPSTRRAEPGRRTFLKRLAATAALSLPTFTITGQSRLRVGVVGGGIVGASIALRLAEAGARVTLFEREAPAAGATSRSFAWLNAMSTDPHYHRLRRRSMRAWHELDARHGLDISWGGVFMWERDPELAAQRLASQAATSSSDYPLTRLTPERFTALAPGLSPGAFEVALHCGVDGHLDPVAVTRTLLDAATSRSVDIVMPSTVTDLRLRGDTLTHAVTNRGDVALDRIVIATGVETGRLTAGAGFEPPLRHAPGILAHSRPVAHRTTGVHYAPGVHFKQFPDGRLVGADASEPPETDVHVDILERAVDFPSATMRDAHGRRILARIDEFLPGARDAALERVTVGYRPMPTDGFPIVGYLPGSSSVYVAVMHSGVTLGAVMGQLVSREITTDDGDSALAPYRPRRFV